MIESTTPVGQTLGQGRYQVKRKLGEGGMAFVLLAFDKNVGIDVVLKVPKPDILADPEFAFRFKREIRSMVTLTHPHIVKIKDVGEHEGIPFYVMELLTGGSLEDRFETTAGKRRPQPPESLADWLGPVARALDFIHRQFVHRDIKPANIMFDGSGNAYVSDFGIVKAISDSVDQKKQTAMTQAGMVIGTCSYIAPEVTEGKKYDGRADQYALAATVYEVLTGRVPFDGATLPAIIMQQLTATIPPLKVVVPTLRDPFMEVIGKGLSRDPKDRFPNCDLFAKALLATIKTGSSRNAGVPATNTQRVQEKTLRPKAVCQGCGKTFLLAPNQSGKKSVCAACGSAVVRETKASARPHAETRTLRKQENARSPISADDRTPLSESDSRRSQFRLIWIAIAVAFALGVAVVSVILSREKGEHWKFEKEQ